MGKKYKNVKPKKRSREDDEDDLLLLPNKSKKPKKQQLPDRPKKMSHMLSGSSIKHSIFSFNKCFWTGEAPQAPPSEELKALRKSMNVNVKGYLHLCPPPVNTVQCQGIPESFGAVFDRVQLHSPTAIQKQAWPAILTGANVLGIAPTGSGKTFAYGLPMIPHILDQPDVFKNRSVPSPVCIVLVPTRELATQVAQTLKTLRQLYKIRTVAVYGGIDRQTQIEQLSSSALHILVATPGRLLDLQSSGEISLNYITYMVIDEADRMLALGFEEQLNAISQFVRPDRQTLLFSATFPGKLRNVSAKWLTNSDQSGNEVKGVVDNSVIIRVNTMELSDVNETPTEKKLAAKALAQKSDESDSVADKSPIKEVKKDEINAKTADDKSRTLSLTVSNSINQHVHVCAAHKKPRLLIKYITRIREKEKEEKVRQAGSMLIFCTKVKTLQFVAQFLEKNGIAAAALHGQLRQQQRENVLADFKAGKTNIVCATDVASRGIHIKRLRYVVNYDFPGSLELYCHRVGRTGRQGAVGDAYSLLTRNMAPLVGDLITLLENSKQAVEPNLISLKNDYIGGAFELDEEEEGIDCDESDVDDDSQSEDKYVI